MRGRLPYHAAAGVHAVAALVAGARGDELSAWLALDAFGAAAAAASHQFDLVFGRPGLLLGCALLLEALPPTIDDAPLRATGTALSDAVGAQIAAQPGIGASGELRSLGAAHGWAGVLFALLRWCQATGSAPDPALRARLAQLAQLAQLAALSAPAGRGARWRVPWASRRRPTRWPRAGATAPPAWSRSGRWRTA